MRLEIGLCALLGGVGAATLFAAQGALGRKLYVVPSLDLVITRIGDNAPQDFPRRFWEKLLLARGE